MEGAGQETSQDSSKRSSFGANGSIGTASVPRSQGPSHDVPTMRACIGSTVSSVIDCFSRENLRGPAEDVLRACAGGQVTIEIQDVKSSSTVTATSLIEARCGKSVCSKGVTLHF